MGNIIGASAVRNSHASGRVTDDTKDARAPDDGRTILDWLDEGSLWLVLHYVPVKYIIISERVSRRWQGVVQRYLKEVGICVALDFWCLFAHRDVKRHPKNRILQIDERSDQILGAIRKKWGAHVVYTFCCNRSELDHISLCCPNLKGLAIQMLHFGTGPLSESQLKFCEKLEQLLLLHDPRFSGYDDDDDYSEFGMYYDDNENADGDKRIDSYRDENIARAFISNLKPTNLISLTVCGDFDFSHFLANIPCFPALTKLTVQGTSSNIPVLFEKTQTIERLVLIELYTDVESCKPKTFSRLKHLTLYECWCHKLMVEVLANCDLHTLSLTNNYGHNKELVQAAIKLIRTAWPSISEIHMETPTVTDNDVAAIIAACPKLKTLDVADCDDLSLELLPPAARAARGREIPPLLKLTYTNVNVPSLDKAQYPELILDTHSISGFWPLLEYVRGVRAIGRGSPDESELE